MTKRRIKATPDAGRRIESSNTPNKSTQQEKPVFSLQYVDNDWCICRCEQSDMASFVKRIRKLSQMTWAEIQNKGRHEYGSESINKTEFRCRLPARVDNDDKLLVLRFTSKNKAMVGFRDGAIYHIIAFDKDFTLYGHG